MTDWPTDLRYPVPPDQEVLESAHLRNLAMMTIGQSALAAQASRWGFFLPPGEDAGSHNRIEIEGRNIVVERLAVLTQSGLAIRKERMECAQPRLEAEMELRLHWALPKSTLEGNPVPLHIHLSLDDPTAAGAPDVVEILGRLVPGDRGLQFEPKPPLLGLGATPKSWEGAENTAMMLERLAGWIENSERGEPYVRATLGAKLRACHRLALTGAATAQVVAAIHDGLTAVLAMVRAYGDADVKQMAIDLEKGNETNSRKDYQKDKKRAKKHNTVTPPNSSDAAFVVAWLSGVQKIFSNEGDIYRWLTRAMDELECEHGFPVHAGGDWMEYLYRLPKGASPTLRIAIAVAGDVPTLPPPRFLRAEGAAFVPVPLKESATGFIADLLTSSGDKELRLRVPKPLEPIVHVIRKGRR